MKSAILNSKESISIKKKSSKNDAITEKAMQRENALISACLSLIFFQK